MTDGQLAWPLSARILAALGGMRDAMTDEDVKAVQRFARWIGEAEGAHATIRLAEAWQRSIVASVDTHPKDGDVQQAPLVSGAVAKPDAQTPSQPLSESNQ